MFNVIITNENNLKVSGRIDSSNASELEEKIFSLCNPGEVFLDMEELEYISSAGLRVLLKLKKEFGDVTVINVSTNVYEIFDITGFAEIINVKKALRSIDITDCECLGSGGSGTVYRLNGDTIVKVFREEVPLADIEAERAFAKAAFIAGIPTAIPFDLIKVGKAYGNVYELMNSDTLSHALLAHPEKRAELMDKYVALVKQLAQTPVDTSNFKSYKSIMMERCERMYPIFGNEYTDMIKEILTHMRDTASTLIHGDLHPGNIMIQNDELMLVDMADMTYGSPIYEIVALYRDMGTQKSPQVAKTIENNIGMDIESIYQTWNDFITRYYGTDNKELLEKQLAPVGLLYAFFVPIMLSMSPTDMQKMVAPSVIEQIIKPVIIPNKDAIKQLLANM